MTAKIAAGILEYGDPDGLYRCLASLGLDEETNGFDLAIIIHNKFPNFPLDVPNAKEETERIISKFPQDKIVLGLVGENQFGEKQSISEIEARNMYFQIAADPKYNCDWVLVIDTDEYIHHKVVDWQKFRSQLEFIMSLGLSHQIFDVMLEGNIPAFRGPAPRLFYRPGSIKYWKRHYWWVLEEKVGTDQSNLFKGQSDAARVIEGIHIIHDHTIRDSKYYNASVKYKEWQQDNE